MNCFNHPETPAIGICKACSKGLCLACATDLGYGIACKAKHEQRVDDLEMILSKNIQAFSDASKNQFIIPALFLFMGFVFAGFGLYKGEGLISIPVVIGGGFIFFGLLLLIRNRKIFG